MYKSVFAYPRAHTATQCASHACPQGHLAPAYCNSVMHVLCCAFSTLLALPVECEGLYMPYSPGFCNAWQQTVNC